MNFWLIFRFIFQVPVWAVLFLVTEAQLTGQIDAEELKADAAKDLQRSKKSKKFQIKPFQTYFQISKLKPIFA